jgi:hypothetical protein
MFRVYILKNAVGKFYIGHTNNLHTRLANHNRTDTAAGNSPEKTAPGTWSGQKPTPQEHSPWRVKNKSNPGNSPA